MNSIESKIIVEGSCSESESNWECKQEEDEDYESSLPEEEIDSKEKDDEPWSVQLEDERKAYLINYDYLNGINDIVQYLPAASSNSIKYSSIMINDLISDRICPTLHSHLHLKQ